MASVFDVLPVPLLDEPPELLEPPEPEDPPEPNDPKGLFPEEPPDPNDPKGLSPEEPPDPNDPKGESLDDPPEPEEPDGNWPVDPLALDEPEPELDWRRAGRGAGTGGRSRPQLVAHSDSCQSGQAKHGRAGRDQGTTWVPAGRRRVTARPRRPAPPVRWGRRRCALVAPTTSHRTRRRGGIRITPTASHRTRRRGGIRISPSARGCARRHRRARGAVASLGPCGHRRGRLVTHVTALSLHGCGPCRRTAGRLGRTGRQPRTPASERHRSRLLLV